MVKFNGYLFLTTKNGNKQPMNYRNERGKT